MVDASTLVRDEAGTTWVVDVAAVEPVLTAVPDVVVMVVLEVARRALNRSFVYGAENEDDRDAGLYLKSDEKRRINATVEGGGAKPALWTLATTRSDATAEDVVAWQDVGFGSDSRFLGDMPWAPS